jgi:hypothetical protein
VYTAPRWVVACVWLPVCVTHTLGLEAGARAPRKIKKRICNGQRRQCSVLWIFILYTNSLTLIYSFVEMNVVVNLISWLTRLFCKRQRWLDMIYYVSSYRLNKSCVLVLNFNPACYQDTFEWIGRTTWCWTLVLKNRIENDGYNNWQHGKRCIHIDWLYYIVYHHTNCCIHVCLDWMQCHVNMWRKNSIRRVAYRFKKLHDMDESNI